MIVWGACACYVYPLMFHPNGYPRCGLCKTSPDIIVPAPKSGRAMTIEAYLEENDNDD